jgi:hypothetical protein
MLSVNEVIGVQRLSFGTELTVVVLKDWVAARSYAKRRAGKMMR